MPNDWVRSIAPALVLFALWLFATASNFDKAFHIDDTAHLEIARWIAENPGRPMSGMLHWGHDVEPIHRTNQPHLFFYLMALWGLLFGWTETAMHSLMAIFALWAIVGFYRLAMLVQPGRALLASSLFALCPAFIVGQNSMVDVPIIALWIEFYRVLLDPKRADSRRYLLAAILCSVALLIKYTSLVLLPALLLHAVLRGKPKQMAWLLLPVSTMVAWSLFNISDYGGIHLFGRDAASRTIYEVYLMGIGWLLAFGATAPFALWAFGNWLRPGAGNGRARFAIVGLAVGLLLLGPAIAVIGGVPGWLGVSRHDLLRVSFLATAIFLFGVLIHLLCRKLFQKSLGTNDWMLCYWLLSTLAFTLVLAPFMATRHVLLAVPPTLLLLSASLPLRPSRAVAVASLTLSASLSVALVMADRWHADVYRQHSSLIRSSLPADAKVWFTGHWGWQWYAASAGMNHLSANCDFPTEGDYVVSPQNVAASGLPEGLVLVPFKMVAVERERWFHRLVSSPAGMYSSGRQILPWALQSRPVEVFRIYRAGARLSAP